MTEDPSYQTESEFSPERQHRPLPITIVPGMQVVDMSNDATGTIVGFTEGFCIFRIEGIDSMSVADWNDVALGPVCPAGPLLPTDIAEMDRRNAGATVLRELLGLKQFGLTPTQTAAYDELVKYLCDDQQA